MNAERRAPRALWYRAPFLSLLGLCVIAGCASPSRTQPAGGAASGGGSGGDPASGGGSNPGGGGATPGGGGGGSDPGAPGGGTGGGGPGSAGGGSGGGPATPAATGCLPVQVDNMAASINPPAGLTPAQVPQFVMFGFDDNAYADGVNWVVNTLFAGRKNSDGSPAQVTFFLIGGAATDDSNGGVFNPAGGQKPADLSGAWANAFRAGHEIGNHTWDHADGGDGRALADWGPEISKSDTAIRAALGNPPCPLVGWRFPFLHFDDAGYQAIQSAGYKYDTSMEFGYDWWQPPGFDNGMSPTSPEYGKHYWWPFTLDNGVDSSFACCAKGVGNHPGMWLFPVHAFTRVDPDDSTKVKTVTGLDFNLWTTIANVDPRTDFCATLKHSFDQRYNGNRAPFNMGAHSDIYSANNISADSAFANNVTVRRAALKCFVDYIFTFPDTRVVTFKDVVAWMRSPKAIH